MNTTKTWITTESKSELANGDVCRVVHNKPSWVRVMEREGGVIFTPVPCRDPWWEHFTPKRRGRR